MATPRLKTSRGCSDGNRGQKPGTETEKPGNRGNRGQTGRFLIFVCVDAPFPVDVAFPRLSSHRTIHPP
jgi:hypothetical protein